MANLLRQFVTFLAITLVLAFAVVTLLNNRYPKRPLTAEEIRVVVGGCSIIGAIASLVLLRSRKRAKRQPSKKKSSAEATQAVDTSRGGTATPTPESMERAQQQGGDHDKNT